MKKKHFYLIAYTFKHGNGNVQLYRNKKIKNKHDLDDVKNFIESDNNLENVALMNIIYFGKQKAVT